MNSLSKLMATTVLSTSLMACAGAQITNTSSSDGYSSSYGISTSSQSNRNTEAQPLPNNMYHEMETRAGIHKHVPVWTEIRGAQCVGIKNAIKSGMHPTQTLIGPLGSDNWKILLHKQYEDVYKRGNRGNRGNNIYSLKNNFAYQCMDEEDKLKAVQVENAKSFCDKDYRISIETDNFGAFKEWNMGNECTVRTYNTMRVHQQGFQPGSFAHLQIGELATPFNDEALRNKRVTSNQRGQDAIVNYNKDTDSFSYQGINTIPDLPISQKATETGTACNNLAGKDFLHCAAEKTGKSETYIKNFAEKFCFANGNDFDLRETEVQSWIGDPTITYTPACKHRP